MALISRAAIDARNQIVGGIHIAYVGGPFPEVADDEIAVYAGDTINWARQVEMLAAWKMLYDGIRDRNLLNVGSAWKGAALYTGVNVDSITSSNRRTHAALDVFDDNDLVIAMGPTLTAGKEAILSIELAYGVLTRKALEQVLKKR